MRLPSSASRGRWRRAEPDSDRVVRRLESVVPDLVSSGSSVRRPRPAVGGHPVSANAVTSPDVAFSYAPCRTSGPHRRFRRVPFLAKWRRGATVPRPHLPRTPGRRSSLISRTLKLIVDGLQHRHKPASRAIL